MKNRIVILLLFLGTVLSATAQSPAERVATWIGANDYYALERHVPALRDSLPPVLAELSDAITGSRFNDYPRSCRAIETLLNNHMEELGDDTASSLFSMLLGNLRLMGEYGKALPVIEMLEQAVDPRDSSSNASLQNMRRMFGVLAEQPRPSLTRPCGDVVLPLRAERETSRNALGEPIEIRTLYTDVEIGGKREKFIFDTGCNNSSFVSQDFAEEHGLRILCDSVIISGVVAQGYARIGTTDSMRLGPVTLHNPLFFITPPNPAIDTLHKVRAVLGTDFMQLAGEIRLRPKEGIMILPQTKTPMPDTGRNLALDSNLGYVLQIVGEDAQPLTMVFDTGATTTSFTPSYFEANRRRIETEGTRKEMGIGGFGGTKRGYGYVLPHVSLRLGAAECSLPEVRVFCDLTSQMEGYTDGTLGTDFILAFDCVTIRFDDMFVLAEESIPHP